MSDYTPSEGVAWSAYVAGMREILSRGGYASNSKTLGAEFKRFVARIKEEAWDQGFDAGERDVMEHESDGWERDCIPNPYREETHE